MKTGEQVAMTREDSDRLNPTIVGVEQWLAEKATLLASGNLPPVSIEVSSGEDITALVPDLEHFASIAIRFGDLVDGRGFSQAVQLRQRWQFNGQLIAVNVLADNIPAMQQCGFDAFVFEDGTIVKAESDSVATLSPQLKSNIETARHLRRPLELRQGSMKKK